MADREYMYVWWELLIKCKDCWKRKQVECYDKWKWYKFWVHSSCKKCKKEWNRKNYESKRDIIAKRNQNYYRNNKDKINSHKREYYQTTWIQRIYKDNLTKELWYNWHTFHVRASKYVNKHKLKPKTCSICGNGWTIEIHHPSYDRYENWSDVVFCCRSCHRQIHSGRMPCPSPISLLELT